MCGDVFERVSEGPSGSGEILVQDGKIAEVADPGCSPSAKHPGVPGHGGGWARFYPGSKAATSVAAELLRRDDLGVLASGKLADIVAMPTDPTDDVSVTARTDFVMKGARVYRSPESAAA